MTEDLNTFMHRKLTELEGRIAALESKPRGPVGLFRRNDERRDDLRGETHEEMVARVREWAKKLNAAGDQIE